MCIYILIPFAHIFLNSWSQFTYFMWMRCAQFQQNICSSPHIPFRKSRIFMLSLEGFKSGVGYSSPVSRSRLVISLSSSTVGSFRPACIVFLESGVGWIFHSVFMHSLWQYFSHILVNDLKFNIMSL